MLGDQPIEVVTRSRNRFVGHTQHVETEQHRHGAEPVPPLEAPTVTDDADVQPEPEPEPEPRAEDAAERT